MQSKEQQYDNNIPKYVGDYECVETSFQFAPISRDREGTETGEEEESRKEKEKWDGHPGNLVRYNMPDNGVQKVIRCNHL